MKMMMSKNILLVNIGSLVFNFPLQKLCVSIEFKYLICMRTQFFFFTVVEFYFILKVFYVKSIKVTQLNCNKKAKNFNLI